MVSEEIKIEEYYQALIDRNSQYLGSFYVGVKTTNIFCIATCRARKPKKENVVFYTSILEALEQGFRPCKVCKPTQNVDEEPVEVKSLVSLINNNPDQKIGDKEIKEMGYSPERIRRWFKRHMNMTFQSYQRMVRMNSAVDNLKNGRNVTDSVFDSGYESLSGFNYTFKNLFDQNPEDASDLQVINSCRFTTPLGAMYACATDLGICLLEFSDRKELALNIEKLIKGKRAKILASKNEHLIKLEEELDEYFNGKRQVFSVPLDVSGTSFQKAVWQELMNIPYGETRSYKQQSIAIDHPKAIRAVANANGKNQLAIIIPCHRIIGSDGNLTGYSGGLPRKKWMLEHERKKA